MTGFFDNDDETFDGANLPEIKPAAIEIKTANSNLGAIRVAVPRDLGHVMRDINVQAQQFGQGWLYRLPFKKKQRDGSVRTEFVEGPTIGCALDVARAYGNCSVDCNEIEEVGDGWIFKAVFLDIETGFRLTRPFRQRKDQNIGGMGGDRGRAEDIIFQIGASKAMRNVTRNALRGLIDSALRLGSKRLTDKVEKDRPGVIRKITDRLAEHNIPLQRIQAHHQKVIADLESFELAAIIKTFQAVQEGLITPDEFYPEPQKEAPKVTAAPKEALDLSPAEEHEPAPPKIKRRVLNIEFRGEQYGKTKYLRDIGQMIKACETVGDLAELQNDHFGSMDDLDDQDSKPIMETISPLFTKRVAKFNQQFENEHPDDQGEEETIDYPEDDGDSYA